MLRREFSYSLIQHYSPHNCNQSRIGEFGMGEKYCLCLLYFFMWLKWSIFCLTWNYNFRMYYNVKQSFLLELSKPVVCLTVQNMFLCGYLILITYFLQLISGWGRSFRLITSNSPKEWGFWLEIWPIKSYLSELFRCYASIGRLCEGKSRCVWHLVWRIEHWGRN